VLPEAAERFGERTMRVLVHAKQLAVDGTCYRVGLADLARADRGAGGGGEIVDGAGGEARAERRAPAGVAARLEEASGSRRRAASR
jgi:hypothetical protein